jgi:hypothetical protein
LFERVVLRGHDLGFHSAGFGCTRRPFIT